MHGLVLETARTSHFSPRLQHSSRLSITLCLPLPQPENPVLSSGVQGDLGEPGVGRGGSCKPTVMVLAWRSPGEGNPEGCLLFRPQLLELLLGRRSEGSRGNRARSSGLATASKLCPRHPEIPIGLSLRPAHTTGPLSHMDKWKL